MSAHDCIYDLGLGPACDEPDDEDFEDASAEIDCLRGLVARLLDNHQRIDPHHEDLCPLCKDAKRALAPNF